MTDEAVISLIFLPGFSTAEVATELSGRGVGMDVVKTNISKLNGTVEITSARDAGSAFTIHIPLTLAHAKYLKAISYAKVKTDKVDSHTLATLLR